ncbi:hypothetical protein [Paenibacillus dokdonensis]|uniref:hypothetical protein n=1 Tax=Paenibacillus dokdonensis TaxID=2567944 RepID=UPI001457AF54|nr:hypothetical protein [Paenibacillus dokdonensis]
MRVLLTPVCSKDEGAFYTPIFAQMIHDGALQWATGDIVLDKEEIAEKVAV